jgi:hypothetical protein
MKLSMKSLGQTLGELPKNIEFESLCMMWSKFYKCLHKHVKRVRPDYQIINKRMTLQLVVLGSVNQASTCIGSNGILGEKFHRLEPHLDPKVLS